MEACRQLGAARASAARDITRHEVDKIATRFYRNLIFALTVCCVGLARAQPDQDATTRQLFQQERWDELVKLGSSVSSATRSAEFDYEYGVALAHLERWEQAHSVLRAASRRAPRDKRFPIELAGVAFKQRNNSRAISYLRHALRLDPEDAYVKEFLATVYFLHGNLEAAVKYWSALDKPWIAQTRIEPALRVRPGLLDHAFAFAPESFLSLEELRATEARLRQLEIFPSYRFDLLARPDGKFDAIFRAQELNGFGNTKTEAVLRLLRGLPFQEVDSGYFNLGRSAVNLTFKIRWDPDKRGASAAISGPLAHDPRWRFRVSAGLRDENWDIVPSFTGPAPVLAALNLRREEFSAEISRLIGSRWQWSVGAELSHRNYRNVFAGTALTPQLLAQGAQLKQTTRLGYELWRSPEHRINVSSEVGFQAGRLWSQSAAAFERVQASVAAHSFPKSHGDDFETLWRIRTGKTFGQIPFDELLMLGLERDNDLWLRAHVGTRDSRKGSAPLGRDYFLSNWETDKNIYSNGFFGVKLGPFVDTGKISDSSPVLGARNWLWDIGVQIKLRVLGVGVTVSYGKDLRTGHNAFYATLTR
jgi:tetratricopeptide (TPR) repeat protein